MARALSLVLFVAIVVVPAYSGTPGEGENLEPSVVFPAKGDTVYVSADLVLVYGMWGESTSQVEPCVPLKVTKSSPSKERWNLKTGSDLFTSYVFWLKGPWLPRFHEERGECREFYEQHGKPTIIQQGRIHEIIPEEDPKDDEIVPPEE